MIESPGPLTLDHSLCAYGKTIWSTLPYLTGNHAECVWDCPLTSSACHIVTCGHNLPWQDLVPEHFVLTSIMAYCENCIGLGKSCSKSGLYAMLLCFLVLANMLWVGYYYAPLTCYYAWNLINLQYILLTDLNYPVTPVYMYCHCAWYS